MYEAEAKLIMKFENWDLLLSGAEHICVLWSIVGALYLESYESSHMKHYLV